MKPTFAAAMLLTLAAAPAWASEWVVDRERSTLGFESLWSGEAFGAVFHEWHAKIAFDPADLAAAEAEVAIDVNSLDTGDPELDDGLKGALGFDVANHPIARFAVKSFRTTGPDAYEALADLTVRGITQEIVLPFTLAIDGDTAHMTGEIGLLRTDFGVGTGMWAGDKPVAHAVTVTVDLTATRTH